jgi:arylsulfatase A-like enzyme
MSRGLRLFSTRQGLYNIRLVTRLRLIPWLILILAVSACVPVEQPPSVVVVVIDSLRADHLHHAGDPRPLSPRLDRLATQSTRFSQAGAASPWTTPSVMSLFTGLVPASHRVDMNDRSLSVDVETLPERLQAAGFATAAVMPALTLADHFGFDRGFDDFIFATQGHNNVSGPWSVNQAIQVLRRHPDDPIFLYVHLWDVHYNYNPPVPQSVRFQSGRPAGPGETDDVTALTAPGHDASGLPPERLAWLEGQYAGEILFTDEQVGRILDELDRQGRGENTIVVVTADHGEAFLEHGVLGHTVDLYDEMTHVPLLVRWPGQVDGDRVIETQVGLVDLAPTLLDLLGVKFDPGEFDGRSLAPVLQGGAEPGESRPLMLETSRRVLKRGLRTPDTAFQIDLVTGEQALHDLQADPGALTNLAEQQPGEVETWHRLLCDRLAESAGREIAIEMLSSELQDSLAAGLRTLGYVAGSDGRAARSQDPELESRRIMEAAGCPQVP